MKCYSYVISRDYGFAPNPFGYYCTLATCKPSIRKMANIGDWVIGTGSARYQQTEHLVFAMKVSEKLTFNQYWNDFRFLYKRPVLNGSLKQTYGDNIYYQDQSGWHQSDSHHSNKDGTANMHNLTRDTSFPFVLISNYFFYFGKNAVRIPPQFMAKNGDRICKKGQGYRCRFTNSFVESFIKWLTNSYSPGYLGDPMLMTNFERYDGIS